MKFNITDESLANDLYDVCCLFYPPTLDNEIEVSVDLKQENEKVTYFISIVEHNDTNSYVFYYNLDDKNTKRKTLKKAVYSALSNYTKKKLPWGCLTGIRPTKLVYDMLRQGYSKTQSYYDLINNHFVSEKKAKLVMEIIENQQPLIMNDNLVDFYINIPFCTTRCNYCSFISAEIDKVRCYIPAYIDALIKEIREAKKIIQEKCLVIKSIYIGGGTPTALSPRELELILKEVPFNIGEFTVEAGRPDTITKEHLDLLKKYGVSRISVNPQSFNDKVLEAIGRKHTALETIEKYKMAKEYGFCINMDLIAGLNKDTIKSFQESLDIAIQLQPQNITVHTLALKRASNYGMGIEKIESKRKTEKMLDYAYETLPRNGYKPYYLYRQKNMLGNLENCGFTKQGYACTFNIDSMEEITSVIACGANAISKRIFLEENRIERQANVKDVKVYLEKIDELIQKKKELFK